MPRDFDPSSLFSVGEFLYAVGPPRKPSLHYFKRDASSGLLAHAGSVVAAQQECHTSMASLVGGRLYFLLTRWANNTVDNRLVWFDVDAKTGKPEEKGVTPMLAWTDRPGHTESAGWGRMLVPSVDQKSLYVATDRAILWFKIEADGRPVPAGQLAGKGIGEYVFAAPDGKWLYTMTHKPVPAIACIECKPNGELALGKIVDLDPKWGVRGVQTEFSMSMTPDGKWLYAADWNPSLGDTVEEGDDHGLETFVLSLAFGGKVVAGTLDDFEGDGAAGFPDGFDEQFALVQRDGVILVPMGDEERGECLWRHRRWDWLGPRAGSSPRLRRRRTEPETSWARRALRWSAVP